MYILEGNIGAGKSTFLQLIKKHMSEIDVALEPLHNWQKKVYGQSLLSNFYQDTKRWAYSLETFAMICRVKEHIQDQANINPNRIVERSIYSGHYCFSINGYKNGFMDKSEWELYQQWFNFLIPQKCLPPRGFIYLRTDPEVAHKRLKKRNRLAEKKISFTYLQQIHDHHEQFLIEKTGIIPILKTIPVLILDCNEEFETNPQILQNHFEQITQFMNEHSSYNVAFQNKVINSPTLV